MRGTAGELAARYAAAEPRGEVVLVIGGAPARSGVRPRPRSTPCGGWSRRARKPRAGGGGRGGADGRAGERAVQGRRRALTRRHRRSASRGLGGRVLRCGRPTTSTQRVPTFRRPRCCVDGRRRRRDLRALQRLCTSSAPIARTSGRPAARSPPTVPARARHLAPDRSVPSRLAVTSVLAVVLLPLAVPSAALAERWLRPVPGEVARTFALRPRRAVRAPARIAASISPRAPGTAVRVGVRRPRRPRRPRSPGGARRQRALRRAPRHAPAAGGRSRVRAGARGRARARRSATLAAGHGGLHLGVRAERRPVRLRRPDDAAARRAERPLAPVAARPRRGRPRAIRPPPRPGPPRRRAPARPLSAPVAPPHVGRSGGGAVAAGRCGRAWRSWRRGAAGSGSVAARRRRRAGAVRRALRTPSPRCADCVAARPRIARSGAARRARQGTAARRARRSPAPRGARRSRTRGSNTTSAPPRHAAARRAAHPAAPLASDARHGLLRHDAHLLRQRGAAPGPRVHDDRRPTSSRGTIASAARTCSSSPAPTSTASRSRRSPSARAISPKELADRNAQRFLDADAADQRVQRLLHPHLRPAPQGAASRRSCSASTTTGTSTRACTRAGTAPGARTSRPRPRSRRATPARSTTSRSTASSEENWFFRLSTFEEPLERLYAEQPRLGGAAHPLQRGARVHQRRAPRRLAVAARSSPGASTVPWDPDHVFYVWFDALLNYYTALCFARDGEDLTDRVLAGEPTTSSARTSSSSTRSSGRRC